MTARHRAQPDFRTLFESVPGLYLVLEPDAPRYTIVAVSDAYARQTLTTRDAIVGKGVFEVFPDNPDDPATTAKRNSSASFARVIATRAPDAMPTQRHDIRRPPEQGGGFEERWWNPVNSPVFGPDGEITYILHRVDDVTALVRLGHESREALRRKEQQLHDLFESAPDGMFIADPDGRYTDVNPAGCRLLGYSREELLGRSIVDLVPPDELARQAALKRHILAGGVEVSEWRLQRKDGTYVPVELSANALPDGSMQAVVRDITERLDAEAALRLSEAKFSGIISISPDAAFPSTRMSESSSSTKAPRRPSATRRPRQSARRSSSSSPSACETSIVNTSSSSSPVKRWPVRWERAVWRSRADGRTAKSFRQRPRSRRSRSAA